MNLSEIYHILEGGGKIRIGESTYHLEKDDSIFGPTKSKQFIENLRHSNLKFLFIVKIAWKEDGNILLEIMSQSKKGNYF